MKKLVTYFRFEIEEIKYISYKCRKKKWAGSSEINENKLQELGKIDDEWEEAELYQSGFE